ncbi:MAG: hypothetical protein R3F13_08870 [Prosthecobacter sp.]
MPRHIPDDDFSFLPTVDSAGEKDVIKDHLWEKKPKETPPVEAVHEEYHQPPPPQEPQPPADEPHEEPVPEPRQFIAPPTPLAASSGGLSVNAPKAAVKVAPVTPSQNGRALWEAYAKEEGGDIPTIVSPAPLSAPIRESAPDSPIQIQPPSTPRVSLGGSTRSVPPPPPKERAPVDDERFQKDESAANSGNVHGEDEPEAVPADNSQEIKLARKKALIATIGLHVAVILVMLLMHVPMLDSSPPEIVATSAVDEMENEAWKKVTTEMPQTSPMAASVSPLLSTGISDIAMPEIDFAATTSELNLGTSFGSFGSGVTTGGAGGKISFLGNTATAKHVVFVVDVSGSMSASMNVGGSSMSRFDLLKKELSKSISAMAAGTAYQILFFSDFAWPHDTVDSNDMRALNDYEWKITSSSRNTTIPRYSYLATNGANVSKSKKIIAAANNPGGTNWGSGLMMALKGATPKPDVIFFMTDGNRSDEQGWINAITQENSRGKRTIIHTTALGTPDAARDLDEMARRNGGKFTAVMADGKIVQGKDLLR